MKNISNQSESEQQKEEEIALIKNKLYDEDDSEIKKRIEIKDGDSEYEKKRKETLINVHKKYLYLDYIKKQPKEIKKEKLSESEKRKERFNKVVIDTSIKLESDGSKTKNKNKSKQEGKTITYETQGGKVVTVFKKN